MYGIDSILVYTNTCDILQASTPTQNSEGTLSKGDYIVVYPTVPCDFQVESGYITNDEFGTVSTGIINTLYLDYNEHIKEGDRVIINNKLYVIKQIASWFKTTMECTLEPMVK